MKRLFSLDVHKLLASSALIQTLGLAATTLIGIQLARYLGPSGYGVYGLIMAVVSVVTVASQFGLPQYAIRESAAATSDKPHASLKAVVGWFLKRSSAIAVAASAVIALLFLARTPSEIGGEPDAIVYAAVAAALFSILAVLIGLLRGAGRNLEGQSIDVLARPLLIAVALFAIHQFFGPLTVDAALMVQIAAAVLAMAYAGMTLLKIPGGSGDGDYAPSQWAITCFSFFSTAMLLAINANYPMLVAGLFVAPADLGIFRVALASAAIVALPSSIANIAVGPMIARFHRNDEPREMADAIAHTTIATFVCTAIGMLILVMAGQPLLGFLFGPEFIPAYVPLLILGAAQLVIAAFGTSGTYLNMTGNERLVVRAFILAVPIGLIASVPLTARYGINGAAVGNLIMVSLWHWYVIVLHRRQIHAPLSLPSAIQHLRRVRRPHSERSPS